MTLAVIGSAREQARIEMVLRSMLHTKDWGFWIDATNLGDRQNSYYWSSSGLTLVYSNWDKSNPDNVSVENCVDVGALSYLWNTANCHLKGPFICQKRFMFEV